MQNVPVDAVLSSELLGEPSVVRSWSTDGSKVLIIRGMCSLFGPSASAP